MKFHPRRLKEEDVDMFLEATEQRPKPKNRDQIIEAIKANNAYRWWRLNRDYQWLRKRMKKMGYSPDDARELLR